MTWKRVTGGSVTDRVVVSEGREIAFWRGGGRWLTVLAKGCENIRW